MNNISLAVKEYRTVAELAGPILVVDRIREASYGEQVEITDARGQVRRGQILEIDGKRAVVQVFEGTYGLDVPSTKLRLLGRSARFGVSPDVVGRYFDGSGNPIDELPPPIATVDMDINGASLNPYARAHPCEFIETGFSVIDGLNTLLRGQKLPIFSGAGLPSAELALQIAIQAKVPSRDEKFGIVFAAIGITRREADRFIEGFEQSGALEHAVIFLNLADAPPIERLLTPRIALTVAEYLAFVHGHHILLILTDIMNYCEALRELGTARNEIPGRRGYPGYLYTDLATIYERAGCLRDRPGSITQLAVLTMPDDDITHPVPDLTGYITEGQIVLSRDLHRAGIFPPVDILPSLSRLMNSGIGKEKTRADHRAVADQLYASYARSRDLRKLLSIVGEGALTAEDHKYLEFGDQFEKQFLNQMMERRTIAQTLDVALSLFQLLPQQDLKRLGNI
jgi:V/A-type H+-transporting ATPase subunit B